MSRLGAIIACFFSLTWSDANASSTERTDQLLWQCEAKQPTEAPELGTLSCARYIDGIMDMQAVVIGWKGPAFFCLPSSGISVDQAIKIFVKWANEHPEELHKTARMSVLVALNSVFPCQ
jgi:hypothetical protein